MYGLQFAADQDEEIDEHKSGCATHQKDCCCTEVPESKTGGETNNGQGFSSIQFRVHICDAPDLNPDLNLNPGRFS